MTLRIEKSFEGGKTIFHGSGGVASEQLGGVEGGNGGRGSTRRAGSMGTETLVLPLEPDLARVGFADDEGEKPGNGGLRRRQFNEGLSDHEFAGIVGSSAALAEALDLVRAVAPTDSTVLIEGETGTGKELIARAIHQCSNRAQRAFVSINCGALAPSLIASELFGHERGAFTGALQQRQGRFELASGGTIFLDEVGELSAEMQVALLRVLQERELERVGGTRSIRVDVRVIAATNRDLEAAVANRTFRSDLFYRLNVFPIEVPPLRERKEDIPLLIDYFVQEFAKKIGRQFSRVDRRTLDLCQTYAWPGNIRELQNVIERSVICRRGDMFWIEQSALSSQSPSETGSSGARKHAVHGQTEASGSCSERRIIEEVLRETRGRVYGPRGAALKLRVPPSTLESRIRALNISKKQFKFS
jgi:formate hydrogenlyase transcriptional activator